MNMVRIVAKGDSVGTHAETVVLLCALDQDGKIMPREWFGYCSGYWFLPFVLDEEGNLRVANRIEKSHGDFYESNLHKKPLTAGATFTIANGLKAVGAMWRKMGLYTE